MLSSQTVPDQNMSSSPSFLCSFPHGRPVSGFAMADEALDAVQYAIYLDATTPAPPSQPASQSQALLNDLRIAILHHLQPLLEGYIWQHQPFNLQVTGRKNSGLWYLQGSTRFGDNIEDEWFIVYLLKVVSEKVAGISITVRDNDGEFLLIEAAYVIPRWLKPENSSNRVFFRGGWVHFVGDGKRVGKLGNLTVEEAVGVMKSGNGGSKASEEVQEAVAQRIKDYPERARVNMHKARCVVPLPAAQVLKHEPQMVSLAVEAFYRRDIDAMRAASKLEKFLPVPDGNEGRDSEMVEILVTMSRAMYAQLHQQVFAPPRKYPMPMVSDPKYKQAELGMKLTCGFEMMYWERVRFEDNDVSTSDEGGIHKELDKALVGDAGWDMYFKSLEKSGYFRGLLEGSREHKQLLQAAMMDYRKTPSFVSTSVAMEAPIKRMKEILSLSHSAADFISPRLPEGDSDTWLFDGEGDLTSAIYARQAEIDAYESRRATQQNPSRSSGDLSGSTQAEESAGEPLYDPEELVQGMQAFISKISSYEGAELPDDAAVSLNMSRFMQELESALGGSEKFSELRVVEEDEFDDSDWDTESDDSHEDVSTRDSDAATATSSTGVQTGVEQVEDTSEVSGDFMEEYSDTLQQELRQTSLAKSFATAEEKDEAAETSCRSQEVEDDVGGIVDVDFNLVTSLLQSYMNQEGMPGPASNLLGAMGIKLADPSDTKLGNKGKSV